MPPMFADGFTPRTMPPFQILILRRHMPLFSLLRAPLMPLCR